MDGHRNLEVWRLARELVNAVYEVVRGLPKFARYIVSAQLCRAAWSVQNNIAEGNAKLGKAELRRFLDVALGSLAEVDSMLQTLPDLYDVNANQVARIDRLRIRITAGIFRILRRGR